MQSLKRGLIFVKQVYGLTRLNPAGLRPSGYGAAAGLVFALVCLLLIGLSLAAGWGSAVSMVLTGFLMCALLMGQIAAGTISSAMTAAHAYAHLTQTPLGANGQPASLQKNWLDLLLYSLASPGLWALSRFTARPGSPKPADTPVPVEVKGVDPELGDQDQHSPEHPAPRPAKLSTGLAAIDTTWINASYLVIPIMSIEGLKLKESLSRASAFIESHALRLSANLIGVRLLSWLVGGLLVLIGIAAGLSLFQLTIVHSQGIAFRSALFASLSIFTFDLFFLAAVVFSAYINTIYATCLYLWSCSAEKARLENLTEPANAPGLLTAALEI